MFLQSYSKKEKTLSLNQNIKQKSQMSPTLHHALSLNQSQPKTRYYTLSKKNSGEDTILSAIILLSLLVIYLSLYLVTINYHLFGTYRRLPLHILTAGSNSRELSCIFQLPQLMSSVVNMMGK